ncbi:hypothetical protein [Idiomarina abyssalis]|uniref:hypothetical protein n=1 Tax=Idiomarina abyssalis TaxID=86102 RepID=UPI003A9171DD
MDYYLLDNSNSYIVRKLRNELGEIQTGGNLTLELREIDPVSGLDQPAISPGLWPVAFQELGQGDYRADLPVGLDLVPGREYTAIIQGGAGGRIIHERRALFAKRRITR